MQAGTMRRLSLVLFGGGLLLLALSFLPRTAEQPQIAETVAEEEITETAEAQAPANTVVESSPEQLAGEGAALFRAKGCSTCHRHADVDGSAFFVEEAPDLTNYQPDPEFVRAWLRDPAAIRPDTFMPNLNLSEEEIEALVAFLKE